LPRLDSVEGFGRPSNDYWDQYKKIFGITDRDVFRGEKDVVDLFERIYKRDKSGLFKVKAKESALLVVDMQNDFVAPGSPLWCPEALRQVPRIKKLMGVCRIVGVPIIFTQSNHGQDCSRIFFRMWPMLKSPRILRKGQQGVKIFHKLRPLNGERVIDSKHSYDAFCGTDLDYILRDLGVRTVIISGTNTNFCCESTARSAFFLHYNVVFGSDVNSTFDAVGQLATLRIMRAAFGRVMTCNEIIRELKESASGRGSGVRRT